MAQPGTHPDADLLNAFAEHALSGTERAQVVAHMAGCARCREIVYLAQSATEMDAVPKTAPRAAVTKPEPVPGSYIAFFARWRVALIPAAALATIGGVVLWVQLHPAPRPAEMAKLASPRLGSPAVTPTPKIAQQKQEEPRAADRQQAVAPSVSASPAAQPRSAERPAVHQLKKNLSPPDSGTFQALSDPAGQIRPPGEIHLDGRSAAMARYLAPQQAAASSALTSMAPEQRPAVRGTSGANVHAPAALAAPSAMVPAPAPLSPGILAVQSEIATAPAGSPSQVATQTLQQADLVSQPASGLPVLRLAKRAKLPSGLSTVSSAALLNRLVAVDSAGSVFFSQDGGRSWEPVFAPWTGKAVEVQAPSPKLYRVMAASDDRSRAARAGSRETSVGSRETAPSDAQAALNTTAPDSANDAPSPPPTPSTLSSAPLLAAKTKAAQPRPAMVFKLVTDRHEVWVSPDGKTWREQ